MTTKYSEEFKASIIARLLPPNNASVAEVAKETGIPKDTLYYWRLKYRSTQSRNLSQPGHSGQFSAEEKLAVVIEAASLNEVELGEYCRRKGLYPEQIAGWKSAIVQGLTSAPSKAEREQRQKQSRTIKQLEKELHRKEKALAEAAALLILQKKFQALLEGPEDEKSTSGSARK
jgi:transposase-like protein